MPYQTIEITRQGRSAWIWLNRPKLHNAYDDKMIAELSDAAGRLGADATVRAVVMAGRGASFCAGADLRWMERAAAARPEENLRDARAMAAMLRAIHRLPKPTIARVHGSALGGGLGLAAVCDITIASSESVFATSETRFGLIPATIAPYVIAAIGRRQAQRYFLTAERFGAAEAHRIGLVHEVGAPEAMDDRVSRLLDSVFAAGPQAQASSKDLVRAVAGEKIDDRLIEDTASLIARIRATPEAREGMKAFLEKRRPAWDDPRCSPKS